MDIQTNTKSTASNEMGSNKAYDASVDSVIL